MKKFLGILLLALLWWNVGFTQELIKIPMYVHIVEINEKVRQNFYNDKVGADGKMESYKKTVDYKTIATPLTVSNDFKKVNEIWKQANIYFNVIQIDKTKAATGNFEKLSELLINYSSPDMHNAALYHLEIVDYKKHDNINGLNVYYIPWLLNEECGFMGEAVLIIGTSKERRFDPNVNKYWSCDSYVTLAHELGHALDLEHVNISGNLMSDLGTHISDKQIKQAREFIKKVLGI